MRKPLTLISRRNALEKCWNVWMCAGTEVRSQRAQKESQSRLHPDELPEILERMRGGNLAKRADLEPRKWMRPSQKTEATNLLLYLSDLPDLPESPLAYVELMKKSTPQSGTQRAYSAQYSGRVTQVEDERVLIEFQVEGEREERLFTRDELAVRKDRLYVGCPVVATTTLEFLVANERPTPEQKETLRRTLETAETEWEQIDDSQTPSMPALGS